MYGVFPHIWLNFMTRIWLLFKVNVGIICQSDGSYGKGFHEFLRDLYDQLLEIQGHTL